MKKLAFVIVFCLASASAGNAADADVDAEIKTVRMAIIDLMPTYPEEYEGGQEFIGR